MAQAQVLWKIKTAKPRKASNWLRETSVMGGETTTNIITSGYIADWSQMEREKKSSKGQDESVILRDNTSHRPLAN